MVWITALGFTPPPPSPSITHSSLRVSRLSWHAKALIEALMLSPDASFDSVDRETSLPRCRVSSTRCKGGIFQRLLEQVGTPSYSTALVHERVDIR